MGSALLLLNCSMGDDAQTPPHPERWRYRLLHFTSPSCAVALEVNSVSHVFCLEPLACRIPCAMRGVLADATIFLQRSLGMCCVLCDQRTHYRDCSVLSYVGCRGTTDVWRW